MGWSADCPDNNPESIRGSKAFQAVPRYSKPFQAFFQKKKIVYFATPALCQFNRPFPPSHDLKPSPS
jgi:hypothetical protein